MKLMAKTSLFPSIGRYIELKQALGRGFAGERRVAGKPRGVYD